MGKRHQACMQTFIAFYNPEDLVAGPEHMPFALEAKLFLSKVRKWGREPRPVISATVVGLENCITEGQKTFPGSFWSIPGCFSVQGVIHSETNDTMKV